MDIVSKKWNSFEVLEIQGRIDGLTSADLKRAVDQAAVEGHRNLVLDFSRVSYMSSAGLRIILQSYKSLNQIGGKLTLVSVPPSIMEVFRISGMTAFLSIQDDLNSLMNVEKHGTDDAEIIKQTQNGIDFECLRSLAKPGKLVAFGSDGKLMSSSYSHTDPLILSPADIDFGLGLAALGDDYSDYKSLFGEAVVIRHHFFSYPAVSRTVVDYSYFSPEARHTLNFLYGIGINGQFSHILRFDASHEPQNIETLLEAAGIVAGQDCFGVVIMGISGGVHCMHLKKAPIIENKPVKGNILDAENFHHWMNFSLESEEINKTIVACGVFCKSGKSISAIPAKALPEAGGMHLHAAVFENGLWSNNILEFENELQRITKEFEPQKVLHLLPGSKLKSGYIALIKLEEN